MTSLLEKGPVLLSKAFAKSPGSAARRSSLLVIILVSSATVVGSLASSLRGSRSCLWAWCHSTLATHPSPSGWENRGWDSRRRRSAADGRTSLHFHGRNRLDVHGSASYLLALIAIILAYSAECLERQVLGSSL